MERPYYSILSISMGKTFKPATSPTQILCSYIMFYFIRGFVAFIKCLFYTSISTWRAI